MSGAPRTGRRWPGRPARAALLSVLAFFILGSYALARPAAESLFLRAYTAARLPLGWLAVTIGAAFVVALYQRAAARVGLVPLLLGALGLSAVALTVLLLLGDRPGVPLLLYVWKDLYVVVLVELFWSLANVLSGPEQARRTYGWFCGLGSAGGVLGNLAGAALAGRIGTRGVLWLVLPVLGGAALCGLWLGREPGARRAAPDARERSNGWGLGLLWRSDYLLLLLLLIAAVQGVITLVDFQASAAIERAYPALDARTAVIGRVYAAIDGSSIGLQLLTAPLLRVFGVGGVLLGVPSLVGLSLLATLLLPGVGTLVAAKVLSKALDYSLFRAAKEMLYLPLAYAEKTRGKALIDMLTYRLAKGGASLLLLGIGSAAGLVSALTLGLVGAWLGLTAIILPRYRRRAAP